MARGALVKDGVVIDVFEAASGLDQEYSTAGAFIPSETAEIGDAWDGREFSPVRTERRLTQSQIKKQLKEKLGLDDKAADGFIDEASNL